MKICLIQPPWGEVYGNYKCAAKIGNAYPPLGLCYLASNINKEHEVKIIDGEFEGLTTEEILKKIKEYSPDIIGITSTTPIFHRAKNLAKLIKGELDIPIIIGGPHFTVRPVQAMEECPYFDYGVYREGEETFSELIENLSKNRSIENIEGLLHRKSGKVFKNPPRELIKNLDELTFPDRRLLKLDKYVWGVPKKGIVKFTTIMTSRGCPFKCIFCSQRTTFGKKVRFRSAKSVIDEIEYIVNNFGIKHFAFIDDTLTLDNERVKKICNGILERRLDITWEGWTRANTINESLLRLMKKTGFVRVSFGIESGNEDILKIIKKGVSLKELENAYKLAKKAGLETRGSVMIGHPFETKETVKDTLRYIKKLKYCDQIHLNISMPYPGTELYEMATSGKGGLRLLTKNFSKYTRYGNSVIEVNDLTKEDLIKLQRKGFLMFYLTPRRIFYNLRRAGLKAALSNSFAFIKSIGK